MNIRKTYNLNLRNIKIYVYILRAGWAGVVRCVVKVKKILFLLLIINVIHKKVYTPIVFNKIISFK